MQDLLDDFQERIDEVDTYYEFLKKIHTKSYGLYNKRTRKPKQFDESIIKILRANVFILLYNLVEATIDQAIDRIYQYIDQENINYQDLTEEIKNVWSKTHVKKNLKFNDEGKLAEKLREIIEHSINRYVEFNKDFCIKNRDNIDSKELRKIVDRFGIQLTFAPSLRGGIDLDTIMHRSNALAHGEILFSQCGRDYSINDLKGYKNNTYIILKKFLKQVDKYIKQKRFKI